MTFCTAVSEQPRFDTVMSTTLNVSALLYVCDGFVATEASLSPKSQFWNWMPPDEIVVSLENVVAAPQQTVSALNAATGCGYVMIHAFIVVSGAQTPLITIARYQVVSIGLLHPCVLPVLPIAVHV